ncbi:MAG: hypothetical protein Q4G71_07435 [Pseudomonadota bacterium]|nr:hypothetical protein [Pseudomonadota bacterium]
MLAVVGAAALLAACAAPAERAPTSASTAAAAPLITTPPASLGEWQDLGYYLAPWLAGDAPVPVSGPAAPTRVAGLKRDDGTWLAVVLVQTAPTGSADCPLSHGLHVDDVRDDQCLRVRRNADFDRWLSQQHAVLYHWLQAQGWDSQPRAWLGYRVPAAAGGGALEVHALVNPWLLEPTTRNNIDFLAGGAPGAKWARQLAAAAQAASASTPLAVPPFPFAPHATVPEAAPPAVAPPAPARATQVTPVPAPPPAPAPRPDRG